MRLTMVIFLGGGVVGGGFAGVFGFLFFGWGEKGATNRCVFFGKMYLKTRE